MQLCNESIAVLPSRGQFAYDVPGELPELVALVIKVYREHKQLGDKLWQAVQNTIPNVDQHRSDGYLAKEPLAAAS